MTTMKMLAASVLLVTGCASMTTGKRRWDGTDIGMQTAFTTAVLLDAEQTVWNNKLGDMRCGESNPIVGPCGDRVPVGVYVPAVLLLHTGVAHAIPHGRWRTLFQAATIGFESAIIYGNWVLGYDHPF